MTVEILLTILTIFSGVTAILTFFGNRRKDHQNEGETSGLIKADLQYIKTTLEDVKNDTRNINIHLDNHSDRLARVEESAKQAHKRIDKIEQQQKKGE